MKKLLLALSLGLLFFKALAQDVAPSNPKSVQASFYLVTASGDTSVYVYKGFQYGWSKLLRPNEASKLFIPFSTSPVVGSFNLNGTGTTSVSLTTPLYIVTPGTLTSSPQNGYIQYSSNGFQFYQNGAWVSLGSGGGGGFIQNGTSRQASSSFSIDGTGTFSLSSDDISNMPTPTRILSVFTNTNGTNTAPVNAIFRTNQTVANTGTIQGIEGYVKLTHTSGTIAAAGAVYGTLEITGTGGTTTFSKGFQSGLVISNGTVSHHAGFYAVAPAISGGGAITQIDAFYAPSGAGGVNVVDNSILGQITATKYIVSGGTSSQFLKADGSSDGRTYLTANQSISFSPSAGDVTGTASGTISLAPTLTIGNNKVTYAKMQATTGTAVLIGNPTGSAGNLSEITLGSGLSFTGSVLNTTGSGGLTLTSPLTGFTTGSNTALTSSNTILTGFQNLQTQISSLSFAPVSGSANYVQNQTGSPQTGGFNLSGNGTLGGNLTVSGIFLGQQIRSYGTATNTITSTAPEFLLTDGTATSTNNTIFQQGIGQLLIAQFNGTSWVTNLSMAYATGNTIHGGTVTAPSFIKSGGTSSQFLKADGSSDGNNYLTANQSISFSPGAGDVTGTASGTISLAPTLTIGNNKVTYAKMQATTGTAVLIGNPTGSAGNLSEITLGSGLSFSGSVLNATSSGISLSSPLTGLSTSTTTAITSSSTVLQGFGQLQGQVNLLAPLASPTFTGTITAPIYNGSGLMTLTGGLTTTGATTINIGAETNVSSTTNIGTGAGTSSSRTVNIGSSSNTSTTNIYSGTGGINLVSQLINVGGSSSGASTVNIGNTLGVGSVNIYSGTFGINFYCGTNQAGLNQYGTFGFPGGSVSAFGKLSLSTGSSNAGVGTATLTSGTVTVSNIAVTSSSRIFLNYTGAVSSTCSILTISSITAGTSFTITAKNPGGTTTNTSDNNAVSWFIVN